MRTLIVGGARSGKSALAERLAAQWVQAEPGREVVVIATADARTSAADGEMVDRIARHRARRPPSWRTVEAPLALADALQREAAPHRLLLVDCLTLWLTNALLAGTDPASGDWAPGPRWALERSALMDVIERCPGELLLVGNEVGHGIVPLGALNRVFVDENGRLHQDLAARCEAVRFVMAGCTLSLKG